MARNFRNGSLAVSDVESENGVFTGDSWDSWIVGLSDLLTNHAMPVGVKNETRADGSLSPFVELVFALEETLPDAKGVIRRGLHSGPESGAGLGLGAAINAARKRLNPNKKQ